MSDFHDFNAERLPDYAVEQAGSEEDFEPIVLTIRMEAFALSLIPDAFRLHLDNELDGLRRMAMDIYYQPRGG